MQLASGSGRDTLAIAFRCPPVQQGGACWGDAISASFGSLPPFPKLEVFKFQCSLIKTKATFLSSKGSWEGDGLGSSVSSVNLTASACVQGSVEKERAETSTSLWLWAQNQCQGAVRLTAPRKGSLTSAGPWEDFCPGFPPFAKASVCPVVWEASTLSAPGVQLPWQNWHQALLHRSAPEGTSWTLRKASGER